MLQFKAIDSDGNKLIDKKEAKDHLIGTKSRARENDLFEQGWNKMDVNRDGKNSLNKFDDSLKDSFPDTKMMKLMMDVRDGLRALEKRVGDLELTN